MEQAAAPRTTPIPLMQVRAGTHSHCNNVIWGYSYFYSINIHGGGRPFHFHPDHLRRVLPSSSIDVDCIGGHSRFINVAEEILSASLSIYLQQVAALPVHYVNWRHNNFHYINLSRARDHPHFSVHQCKLSIHPTPHHQCIWMRWPLPQSTHLDRVDGSACI